MYVTDLKYGKGVQVFAEDNPQAILYALGALDAYDPWDEIEEIHIRICQPRLNHKDVWIVTREQLLQWGAYIKSRFALALTDNPPFGPSEKACKFCKVAARCRALAEHLNEHRALAFDDLTEELVVSDPRLLTDEELVSAWRLTDLVESRLTAVAKEVMRVLLNGGELPGVKLVEAQTKRRFKDESDVRAFLMLDCDLEESKLFSRTMLSPNQVEKLLPKAQRKALAEYVYKPSGGPCIVDASSKRPPYAVSGLIDVDDAFVDETETDEF